MSGTNPPLYCAFTLIAMQGHQLLFLTFSILVANNPKNYFYTVANPARGLLNRGKRTKDKVWQHTPPPSPGSPYLQHRVATLLVQHGRRHQNHPTRNPFLKSCLFRLCLIQAAVVNLFVLNLVYFISVCPCIPETGRLENFPPFLLLHND